MKKGEKAYLPTFLRKPKEKSTGFPISIDYRPELSESKQGRTGEYGKMEEIIAASYQGNKDENDSDSKSLLGDAIFAMRGFGTFDVGLGIGSYGQDSTGAILRRINNEKELIWEEGIKCNMSNRVIDATTKLKFGPKRLGAEGTEYAQQEDFSPMDRVGELGIHSSAKRHQAHRLSRRWL